VPRLFILSRKAYLSKSVLRGWQQFFFAVFIAVFAGLSFLKGSMDPSIYISLSILLFSGCCIAAFWFSYGRKAVWAGLFPLGFLVLMTPVPDAWRQRVIVFLQYGSAVVTDWFFSAANIPFSRDGVIIVLPSVTIEIAQECSGIRSSVILSLPALCWDICFSGKSVEDHPDVIAGSSYNY
jgi:hypothetical protein